MSSRGGVLYAFVLEAGRALSLSGSPAGETQERPAPRDLVLAGGLGALVGGLRLLAAGHRTVSVLTPVIAATTVSALTFLAVRHGLADPGLRTLVAPLVAFLPGGVLTTGTIELASGEVVAGASRVVFGALQQLLLAFGIAAGAKLAGLPPLASILAIALGVLRGSSIHDGLIRKVDR